MRVLLASVRTCRVLCDWEGTRAIHDFLALRGFLSLVHQIRRARIAVPVWLLIRQNFDQTKRQPGEAIQREKQSGCFQSKRGHS